MRVAAEGAVSGESSRARKQKACVAEGVDCHLVVVVTAQHIHTWLHDRLTKPHRNVTHAPHTGMALQTGANSVRPSQLDLSTMSYQLGVSTLYATLRWRIGSAGWNGKEIVWSTD